MNNPPVDTYLRNRDIPEGWFGSRTEASVSVEDRGFLLGDGVYEVVRAYHGQWFRMAQHIQRLQRSLQRAQIETDCVAAIPDIADILLRRSGFHDADVHLYIQITRGVAPRTHAFPVPAPTPTLYMTITPAPDCSGEQVEGIAVTTLSDFRWHRCDIKTISLQANVLAIQEARNRGDHECLFVRDGAVTEGSHTNFFGVRDGVVWTHPTGPNILAGITRECVVELCGADGIPIREEALPEAALRRLDEAFLTATSWEVVPVVRINAAVVGDGSAGPVTRRLQYLFRRLTRAKL